MKTQHTNRRSTKVPNLRLLKSPTLDEAEGKVIDLYIAARRREQAGKAAAANLKPRVLAIVKVCQQVSRRGALVSLDKTYDYKYSGMVTALAKTLAEERERERENGIAQSTITDTVAFEDIRRRERERREAQQLAA